MDEHLTDPTEVTRDRQAASVQQRVEASPAGRRLINAFLVGTLLAILVSNLPTSEVRRRLAPVFRPFLNATGLVQSWKMFAPDPPRQSRELLARVHYADGSVATWRPPVGGAALDSYRGYHWRKWAGLVAQRGNRRLWKPTATWIAEQQDHQGRRPVKVQLVSRTQRLRPPGDHRPPPAVREKVFYTLVFRERGHR